MKNQTLEYYENNAGELSQRYESTELDSFHHLMAETFPAWARVLEIGCGSGRDAARAYAAGFDIQAVDGSANLLLEATRLHPELTGRLHQIKLPGRMPFDDASFACLFSVACLMHFRDNELPEIVAELARVLQPGGKGLVSVPAGRSDIDSSGLDQNGRIFNVMPAENWQQLFAAAGFTASPAGPAEPDSLGRPGITWQTFKLHLAPGTR